MFAYNDHGVRIWAPTKYDLAGDNCAKGKSRRAGGGDCETNEDGYVDDDWGYCVYVGDGWGKNDATTDIRARKCEVRVQIWASNYPSWGQNWEKMNSGGHTIVEGRWCDSACG